MLSLYDATIYMYREVSWEVPADPYILEELGKHEGWHTAKNLESNTSFSRQWASQRCPVFVENGLAERHEDEPAYRIAEEIEYEDLDDPQE